MRLLYLMPTGFDTPSANNHLAEAFLGAMLDAGMEVHMVAGRRSGVDPDVPEGLSGARGFSCEIVDRGTVDKTRLLRRLGNELSFIKGAEAAARKEAGRVDVVLVQSSPLAFIQMPLLKRILRAPIVYSAYEIIPDYTGMVMKRRLGPLYYAYRALQDRAYRAADLIVAASEDMRATLVGKGVPEEDVAVVPNWYNDRLVHEVAPEENRFIAEAGTDARKFIVQYAGNIGYVFDVDYLLGVADAFRENSEVEFHIIGEGAQKAELVSRASKMGLPNIRFFPWQPESLISDVYSACDIALVPLAEGTIFNAYPSKSSLLMACGTPVVYSMEKQSLFAELVESEGLGYVVERGSVRETVAVIDRARADRAELGRISLREKEYARRELRASVLAPAFANACRTVLEKQNRTAAAATVDVERR